jgi:hypothetical protein
MGAQNFLNSQCSLEQNSNAGGITTFDFKLHDWNSNKTSMALA